jgi:hypothetical protein
MAFGAGTLRVQTPLRQDDDESLSAGRLAEAVTPGAKVRTDTADLIGRNIRLTRLCRPFD